jgi:hypothetical protein
MTNGPKNRDVAYWLARRLIEGLVPGQSLASVTPATCPYDPKDIPYAGIQVGEIIAWRGWRIMFQKPEARNQKPEDRIRKPESFAYAPEATPWRLVSVARENVWEPGEPMIGNINKQLPSHPWRAGVFAAKEVLTVRQCLRTGPGIYALGQVALYGEVVEHKDGYRATHAMPFSIDELVWAEPNLYDTIHGRGDYRRVLAELCRIYFPQLREQKD